MNQDIADSYQVFVETRKQVNRIPRPARGDFELEFQYATDGVRERCTVPLDVRSMPFWCDLGLFVGTKLKLKMAGAGNANGSPDDYLLVEMTLPPLRDLRLLINPERCTREGDSICTKYNTWIPVTEKRLIDCLVSPEENATILFHHRHLFLWFEKQWYIQW